MHQTHKLIPLLLITPLCIAAGGFLNVIGTYNQQHIVGIESSRSKTYSNTPHGSILEGVNFLDTKVTRSLISTATIQKDRYIVDGVEYICKAPPGYFFLNQFQPRSVRQRPKVKLTKEGTHTICTLLFQ